MNTEDLAIKCPNCGELNEPSQVVCSNCGQSLKPRASSGWLIALIIGAIPMALFGGSCLYISVSDIRAHPRGDYIGIFWATGILSAGLLLISASLICGYVLSKRGSQKTFWFAAFPFALVGLASLTYQILSLNYYPNRLDFQNVVFCLGMLASAVLIVRSGLRGMKP